MTCPVCFFSENHQKNLKMETFGVARFELKLDKYRDSFIQEIRTMGSLKECDCYQVYGDDKVEKWIESFFDAVLGNIDEISFAFDEVITVYEDFINLGVRTASDTFWKYLNDKTHVDQAESVHQFSHLLFRGRKEGGFDKSKAEEYFHIPFSKRHLVGNQRFSVSGQPMLYFGSSVISVVKELNLEIGDISIAGLLPNYSEYYNKKIFSLCDHIESVVKNLPALARDGVGILYDNDGVIQPNKSTVSRDIHQLVLKNLCTFPVETYGSFVAEYVIPQILTSVLLDHEFDGILFPSTKSYDNLKNVHKYSFYHRNLGLFVPYDSENDISIDLLNGFEVFLPDRNSSSTYSIEDLYSEVKGITDLVEKSDQNNNDYIVPHVMMQQHIQHLKEATDFGVEYYKTSIGVIELQVFMKMLNYLKGKIV